MSLMDFLRGAAPVAVSTLGGYRKGQEEQADENRELERRTLMDRLKQRSDESEIADRQSQMAERNAHAEYYKKLGNSTKVRYIQDADGNWIAVPIDLTKDAGAPAAAPRPAGEQPSNDPSAQNPLDPTPLMTTMRAGRTPQAAQAPSIGTPTGIKGRSPVGAQGPITTRTMPDGTAQRGRVDGTGKFTPLTAADGGSVNAPTPALTSQGSPSTSEIGGRNVRGHTKSGIWSADMTAQGDTVYAPQTAVQRGPQMNEKTKEALFEATAKRAVAAANGDAEAASRALIANPKDRLIVEQGLNAGHLNAAAKAYAIARAHRNQGAGVIAPGDEAPKTGTPKTATPQPKPDAVDAWIAAHPKLPGETDEAYAARVGRGTP